MRITDHASGGAAVAEPVQPPAAPAAKGPEQKRINVALQGGGSHGAFAWGVLDRLLEDGRIAIDGVCGTSAGAMNATVLAYGLHKNGQQGARDMLDEFWRRIGDSARMSPLQPTWLDQLLSPGNIDFNPMWMGFDFLSRVLSPYQLNPTNWHPLREVLEDLIDFDSLRACRHTKLFLCATNVKSGRIKVFDTQHVSLEAVLASACLPFMFQAVEVDGEHYWDGGYMGNPPIYPLIYGTDTRDVLIIQINPVEIPEVPTTSREIFDRINTLSFNSSLMREMRAIHFVTKLIDQGHLDPARYKRVNVHTVGAGAEMAQLGVSSKLNASSGFLLHLYGLGRSKAEAWLAANFEKVGRESSADIAGTFL